MKLTETQLRQIIREEIEKLNEKFNDDWDFQEEDFVYYEENEGDSLRVAEILKVDYKKKRYLIQLDRGRGKKIWATEDQLTPA